MSRRTTEPLAVILVALAGLWAVPELSLVWLAAAAASVACVPLGARGRAVAVALAVVGTSGVAIAAEKHRETLMEWRGIPSESGAPGVYAGEAPGYNGPVRLVLTREVVQDAQPGTATTRDEVTLVESSECAVSRARGADGISGATRTELARRHAAAEAGRASFAAADAEVPKPGLLERHAIRPLETDGAMRLTLLALAAGMVLSVLGRGAARSEVPA